MSSGPETRFIASVHRLLPTKLYHLKQHNAYVGGPADVWYSGNHTDAWIEYKYVETLPPIIDLMDLKKGYCLSALQQEWLHDRSKEGRNVFVILGCREGGVIFVRRNWEQKHKRGDIRVLTRPQTAEWISMLTEGSYEIPVKRSKRVVRCI